MLRRDNDQESTKRRKFVEGWEVTTEIHSEEVRSSQDIGSGKIYAVVNHRFFQGFTDRRIQSIKEKKIRNPKPKVNLDRQIQRDAWR
jgi:hypothetical protein